MNKVDEEEWSETKFPRNIYLDVPADSTMQEPVE